MKCSLCGYEYPSRYHFVNGTVCLTCFEKMPQEEKDKILKDVDSMNVESPAARTVNGKSLVCPVCGHKEFWKRETLMNTPGMTFWGLDWANRQAENLICDSCGYIFWFFKK